MSAEVVLERRAAPGTARPRRRWSTTRIRRRSMPVDVDAGDRAEDHRRHQEAQDQQADRGARAGQANTWTVSPIQHHVAADLGDDLRDPQRQEAPVAQDGDGRSRSACRGGGHATAPFNEAAEATLELASLEQHAVARSRRTRGRCRRRGATTASRVRSARMPLGKRQPIADPQLERCLRQPSDAQSGGWRRAAVRRADRGRLSAAVGR